MSSDMLMNDDALQGALLLADLMDYKKFAITLSSGETITAKNLKRPEPSSLGALKIESEGRIRFVNTAHIASIEIME